MKIIEHKHWYQEEYDEKQTIIEFIRTCLYERIDVDIIEQIKEKRRDLKIPSLTKLLCLVLIFRHCFQIHILSLRLIHSSRVLASFFISANPK